MSPRHHGCHPSRLASPLLVMLLLGGCMGVQDVTGLAMQQDLVQIRADVAALQANLQRARTEMDRQSKELDVRVREQTAGTQQKFDELARRVDALSTSVGGVSARFDELNARIEALNRRLATAPTPAPTPGRPSGGREASQPPAPRQNAGPQPQDLYQTAYLDFSKGSYQLAIAGFQEFLKRYPDHALADDAQYWVGEAYFSLARAQVSGGQPDKATPLLERAIQEFRKVIANYPRGDKASTALYKEALGLIELKQPALAQSRLQYLIDNFPQSEEAPLARDRLSSLKGS